MLDANSIAMVFADLPFGVTRCVWDSVLPLHIYWSRLAALCKKRCAHIMPATNPFASKLILSNSKRFRYDIVWHKSRTTGYLNARKMPLRAHELLLIFYDSLPTYNPQMRKNLSGRVGQFAKIKQVSKVYGKHEGGQIHLLGAPLLPHSVVQMKTPNSERGLHPTQKPLALLEWVIATYTNPGDTVLDPVFGSNTTAVACARLGRNYIGIEKDAEYFRIGTERVNAERAKLGLTPAQTEANQITF